MSQSTVPILTYHSMNTAGNAYPDNNHVALYDDLRLIQSLGKRIIPLQWIAEWVRGERAGADMENAIGISFDDGPNHDFLDWVHPVSGPQQGFYTILKEFKAEHEVAGLHATSFVIASPAARVELDQTCMRGEGWWQDSWWPAAEASGLMSIQNHSWDHLHPTLSSVRQREQRKGNFEAVATEEDCEAQVRAASQYIASVTGEGLPTLFAYPWGQSSEYLREVWLPENEHLHGLHAAFSIQPRAVSSNDNRWHLPRFVCGDDWRTPQQLQEILLTC